jgi:hypothetical protein
VTIVCSPTGWCASEFLDRQLATYPNLMKALLILAATAIGTLIGYAMSDGFGGGPTIGNMLNGMLTLMFMGMGGGIGLALGAVIAVVLWASESEASTRQDSPDQE